MSLSTILQIASEKNIFLYFPCVNTMTCGGSHLGFPIGIKNREPSNDHSWAVWFQLSKWFQRRSVLKPATAGHRLTLDPMEKYSNAFFSETTNMIKAKLYMNVHWMVLYKPCVFCSDIKFKMAATAGLSLTMDPMGSF
jgi:hypothetical protein